MVAFIHRGLRCDHALRDDYESVKLTSYATYRNRRQDREARGYN